MERGRWLDRAPLFMGLVVALQTIAMRWYWPLPDHLGKPPPKIPGPWYLTDEIRVTDLFSYHADARRSDIVSIEHFAIVGALLLCLLLLSRRESERALEGRLS
jgi:hypothetical protein